QISELGCLGFWRPRSLTPKKRRPVGPSRQAGPAGPAPPRPYAHWSTCSVYSVSSTREARARPTSGQARSSERGQRPNSSRRTDTRPAVVARSGRPHLRTNRTFVKLRRPHRPKSLRRVGPEQLTQFAFRPAGGPTEAGTAAQTWRSKGSTPRRGVAFVGAT